MNKRRLIFFAVFGFYHVVLFLFTLYIDSQKNDFSILSKMLTSLPLFKWGALLGLLMLVADVALWWLESRSVEKEREASRLENNTLKAKVYDYQESSKGTITNTPS